MLLRALDILAIFLFFGTIPVIIKFKAGFNYYWDYIDAQFHDETLENYDFIVGKGVNGLGYSKRCKFNNI